MSSFMSSFITSMAVFVGVTVVVVWLSVTGLRTYTERRTRRKEEAAEQIEKSLAEMRNSLSPQKQRLYQGDYDVEDTGHDADQRRATEAESWATFHLGSVFDRQGNHAQAVEAYQQVIDSSHPEAAPRAAFNLGILFEERGEYTRAVEAYRRAIRVYQQVIDSGHPEEAPRAAFDLGLMLDKLGEYNLAEQAYQQAINSGHPEVAP